MEAALFLLAASLVAALAGVVALLWSQRRTRAQLAAIMDRIDELESRTASQILDESRTPASGPFDATHATPEGPGGKVSRDVLAGRTSFVRRATGGELVRPTSLAGQAIAAVHARIQDNVSPADLAAELAISLRTLERGLGIDLGCSPRQLIMAMKMREARRLLESGRYRVNEVASRLGFTAASHFSRSFRAFYRFPPSAVVRQKRP